MPSYNRCVAEPRELMVKKCLLSLIKSIESCSIPDLTIALWIIDDHSSPDFLAWIDTVTTNIHKETICIQGTGHQDSAVEQFASCKRFGSDLIYMVEDDYFHAENAIELMVQAHTQFSQLSNMHDVALYPYDCIDRYHRDFPYPCRIFFAGGLYWRTIRHIPNTVLMKHRAFVNAYEIFHFLAANYELGGTVNEDTTVNKLYNNMVDFGGPLIGFSPIPSLAIHLEYQEPTAIINGLVNWRTQWDNFTI